MPNVLDVVNGYVRDRVRARVLATAARRGGPAADLFDARNRADPYPMYRSIRERGQLVSAPWGTLTADHATCDRILRHPRTTTATGVRNNLRDDDTVRGLERWLFSTPDRTGVVDPLGPESMIGMDGVDHARLRGMVGRVFTPAAVARLRPRLTSLAEDLVASARRAPVFDLMRDVAGVLPVVAICEVLGIPEVDHRRFKAWGSAVAADLDGLAPAPRQRDATVALRELSAYLTDLVELRRAEPCDDVLSGLVHVDEDGARLTDTELLATAMLLLIAGFETTVNLIGNGTLALLEHPDQQAWLREDLDRVPTAVEELLRFDAPVQLSARFTGEPMQTDSGVLPAGSPVTVMLGGANRDPAVFDEPDRLDLSRPNARRHLAFASGPHYCLGAALARLEGDIAFTVLLDQLGELRLAAAPVRRPTFVLRGLDSLPLSA